MRFSRGIPAAAAALAVGLLVGDGHAGAPAGRVNPTDALVAEFARHTGARLVFTRAGLPAGEYHDVMLELDAKRREAAARIALAEAKKYPQGYLGAMGLGAIGVFKACLSKEGDGFRPYDKALGGYRYYGIWNGKDGIAAAYYGDEQLPLTLHHEIFHHVDGSGGADDDARFAQAIAGKQRYAAPTIAADDLKAMATRGRGWVLQGAVSDYAAKSAGEDQAETARYLMSALPDALVQVASRPTLPGSQRLLHVLAQYRAAHASGPDVAWLVDVALGRTRPAAATPVSERAQALRGKLAAVEANAQVARGAAKAALVVRGAELAQALMQARVAPGGAGSFAIHGGEDADGVNWTLRADVASFGRDLERLGKLGAGQAASHAALTRGVLANLGLLARYQRFIAGRWSMSEGTRRVFEDARVRMIGALPASRVSLAQALIMVPLATTADLVTDAVARSSTPTATFVASAAAAGAELNPYLDNIDAEIPAGPVRRAIRAVQPATVRVSGGSGVNVAPRGVIVTAAHVADGLNTKHTIHFPDGRSFPAVCTHYDERLDLAVLTISVPADLPIAPIAAATPKTGSWVTTIGQPGTRTPDGAATGYQPFHVSTGELRGFLKNLLGPQSPLGTIKHDAWTYWGHSGAPLFDSTGHIVALHNSWDPRTAMRHAIPGVTLLGLNLK